MKTRASISSSTASGSLKPSPAKNLIPLSGTGLCEAEIIAPAQQSIVRARYANPGVGITPALMQSPPTDRMPAVKAASSMSPEIRVSFPMMIRGLAPCRLRTYAPARPRRNANSAVRSLLATPLTPSVPKRVPILLYASPVSKSVLLYHIP